MSGAQPKFPYQNPDLPTGARVRDLLSRMSREQKVGQMMQLDARGGARDLVLDRHVGSILHASPETVIDAHTATLETELKIPLLVADDLIHGYSFWEGATIFPTQLGMSATWDPDLVEAAARITAVEGSETGIHWTFSPVLDVARDLRWGRINETFGEDPYLIGVLGTAMVRGYQGNTLRDPTGMLATAKHFAGYSETQGGRDASEADLSHRKLLSWFLPPYQRVAAEGVATFMLGYQTTDGVPITIDDWLLTDVLRRQWGYHGLLITDWDNVGRMVWEQNVMPDYKSAAAAAVNAGVGMVMTTPQFYQGALDALEEGLISEDRLDEAVARILTLKFEMGLFEYPRYPHAVMGETHPLIGCEEHQMLNLELTRRSIVLLQNDGVLPLPTDSGPKKVAVVGPLSNAPQEQLGDWAGNSGQVAWMPDGHPRETITTVFEGFEEEVPEDWQVLHANGAKIAKLVPNPDLVGEPKDQPTDFVTAIEEPNEHMIAKAVKAAEEADYVVAVVGDVVALAGETRSTATLELMGGQKAMLDAVAATGKPMIVVIMASKPLVLPPSVRNAEAILWAANPGQWGGKAIAEIILGKTEPTGRLAISFPEHVGQQPTYYNQIRGQHGDRYADLTQEPAFVFGEGLSYTTVEYGDACLDQTELGMEDAVVVNVPVTNTGERPATEVVQAYIRDLVTSASWAEKELKGYALVDLEPGETVDVRLQIPVAACSIVNAKGVRVVEPGEFEVLVGESSKDEDLHALRFEVE